MIRTSCPKCGREDAVADYLASLPILCNGCGTRVTVGDRIAGGPLFAPPVAPLPPPPPKVPPPPVPVAHPAPPPPKAKLAPPPRAVVVEPKPVAKVAAVPPPPAAEEPATPLVEIGPFSVVSSPLRFTGEGPPPDEPTLPDDPAPAPLPAVPAPQPPKAMPAPPPKAAPAPTPAVAEEPPFPLPLAGVGRRLLARFLFLMGLAMMVGLGFTILMVVPKSVTRDPYIMWAIVAACPVIYLLANAAMLARTGQDVGKRYAGIRVVNADGSKASEKTALLKRDALTFVIGLTGVGLLYWLIDFASLFGKGGRTLHDRIAGTRVVRA